MNFYKCKPVLFRGFLALATRGGYEFRRFNTPFRHCSYFSGCCGFGWSQADKTHCRTLKCSRNVIWQLDVSFMCVNWIVPNFIITDCCSKSCILLPDSFCYSKRLSIVLILYSPFYRPYLHSIHDNLSGKMGCFPFVNPKKVKWE